MNAFFKRLTDWRPQFLSLLRIVTTLLFLEHATQKLFGFPGFSMPPGGMPGGADGDAAGGGGPPGGGGMSGAFLAIGILELVGSLLLLVGWQTRIAAFVLSGEMAVAYWMAHAPQSFYPIVNGGEAAIMFCFVYLYIAAAGPGAWSIDTAQKSPMA